MVERISRPRSSRPSRVAKSVIQASRSSGVRSAARPREPRVLERPGEAGAPVGPLGHDVRAQRDHTLDVRGEVRGGDLVRDVEDLREELAEDAVTHRGPGAAGACRRGAPRPRRWRPPGGRRHRHRDDPDGSLGSVALSPLVDDADRGPVPRRAWATRRVWATCGGGTAGPEGGEAEGAGAGHAARRVTGEVFGPARSSVISRLGRQGAEDPRPGRTPWVSWAALGAEPPARCGCMLRRPAGRSGSRAGMPSSPVAARVGPRAGREGVSASGSR